MFCTKCGNQIAEGAGFCHKCGTKIVRTDASQEAPNTSVPPASPIAANAAKPLQQVSVMFAQAGVQTDNANNFKMFVDNHVRTTTKFQSADDLLKNSKPWNFLWICLAIVALVYLVIGLANNSLSVLGFVVLVPLFGYATVFIASVIIRMRYSGRFGGEFIGDINIEEFIIFLNGHLKHIHSDFHEWGYLSKKGLLSVLENTIANATQEVRICSEFGPNRKSLIAFYIKPKTIDAKPGEKLYFVDALKNGFLIDGRAAGFLGHGTLIRTAPILQATMEYYLKSKGDKK